MKTAYFDCFSGASGDMILGALVDVGMPVEALVDALKTLPADGWDIEARTERRQGVAGTRVEVKTEAEPHAHRRLNDILQMIQESGLNARVQQSAVRVFQRLAEAEAKAHGVSVDHIHFHEVGALDAVIDVVGAAAALDALGIEHVAVSPLPVGRGFIRCEHGVMPNPAPGTAELLRGVPVMPTQIDMELVTPTGAAVLTTLADSFGAVPPMTVEAVGYGTGKRDFKEQPNLLRVYLGESAEAADGLKRGRTAVIETNIDDQPAETLGYLMERLMENGALDAFFTPIVMKKSRPAHQLSVIAHVNDADRLARFILRESTTLGARVYETSRTTLPRRSKRVETPYGSARVVVAEGGGIRKTAPEYEDCRRLAEETGAPIHDIYRAAVRALMEAEE